MKIIDTKILQRSVVERIITSVSYDSGDFNTCPTWYGDGETLDNIYCTGMVIEVVAKECSSRI